MSTRFRALVELGDTSSGLAVTFHSATNANSNSSKRVVETIYIENGPLADEFRKKANFIKLTAGDTL